VVLFMSERRRRPGRRRFLGSSPASALTSGAAETRVEDFEDIGALDAAAAPAAALQLFVAFSTMGAICAAPVTTAREILRCGPITRVPAMPPWLRGVTNVRGQVIPVADLPPRFGLPPTRVTQQACILMVDTAWKGDKVEFGLLVESIVGILALGEGDLEPPPSFGTRIPPQFLIGLGRRGDQFALVLDLPHLLSPEQLLPEA
jgi:purine-binding chemotaxis protein CheW